MPAADTNLEALAAPPDLGARIVRGLPWARKVATAPSIVPARWPTPAFRFNQALPQARLNLTEFEEAVRILEQAGRKGIAIAARETLPLARRIGTGSDIQKR